MNRRHWPCNGMLFREPVVLIKYYVDSVTLYEGEMLFVCTAAHASHRQWSPVPAGAWARGPMTFKSGSFERAIHGGH